MKAFEKWWIESCKKEDVWPTDERLTHEKGCYKAGWKVALEWALRECVLPNGMISETLIKRELEP